MPILDQYGNPVTSGSGGRFANAANRNDRAQPLEPLFTDSFDKLVPDWDRKALLSGSRKMFMNFPPYEAAITMKADHVVGRAWNAKFHGEDKDWGKVATDWLLNQWYGMCDLSGSDFKSLLWLDCVSLDRDGDYLVVLEPTSSGWPMTRRIPANRIGQRGMAETEIKEGKYKGSKMTHGVIYDRRGAVIAYNILGDNATDDIQIDANDCVFNAEKNWHDQSRGLPTGSSSLKFIRSSLLSHEWEQMAQLMVSSIGLVEYNETGGPDIDDPGYRPPVDENGNILPQNTNPTTELLQNGTIRYFRSNSGGKIEQIKHERPGDMWSTFQDRVIRLMSKGVKVPYELSWKANEINAAMVRNIQEQMRMTVEDRQDTIYSAAIRTVRWAIAKAIKEGILPQPKNQNDWWKWGFIMPRKFSVDQGRDAAQRREDFKIGILNKSKIVLEEGGDLEQLEDDRIETVFRYEKKIRAREESEGFTVDRRKFEMLTANEVPVEDTSTDDKTKKEEDQ
jgi:capsid protein